jgi:hypothetical protein
MILANNFYIIYINKKDFIMNKMSLTLIICGLFFTCLSSIGGNNIAENEDFEEGLKHWKGHAGHATPQVDSKVFLKGKKSIRFDIKGKKNAYLMQSLKADSSIKKYRISGWTKKSKNFNYAGYILGIVVYKEGGKYKYKYFCGAPKGAAVEGWKFQDREFEVPKGTVAIRIFIKSASNTSTTSNGSIWFDNIILEPVSDKSSNEDDLLD